tara:strand:- start:180 stop:1166 length:987 start_codon:yes stop_codon:yes gene_type:complete
MNNLIAITIGDIKGIGINILLNAWKNKRVKNFILLSDSKLLNKFLNQINFNCEINEIDIKKKNLNYNNKKLNVYSYKSHSFEDNTYKSLKFAYELCKKNLCIGIVTLPLRKDLIQKEFDKEFIGHTEYFQKLDKKKHSNMILYHKNIIISPLTTHIELKKVSKIVSNKKFLYEQLFNLYHTLKDDFNIKSPKIIISGINPHAGENGKIGTEEIESIIPCIKKLKNKGIKIEGPNSADSLLINKNLKKYNCFVFIYHDQALIPFKYISQFSGVNYTGNLDIIRTSPDHGTAYDLIKSKKISYLSFLNCFELVKKVYKNRKLNVRSKKIS